VIGGQTTQKGNKISLPRIVTDEFPGGQRPDGKDGFTIATGQRLILIHRPEGQLHRIGIAPAPPLGLFFHDPQIGRSVAPRPKHIVTSIRRPRSQHSIAFPGKLRRRSWRRWPSAPTSQSICCSVSTVKPSRRSSGDQLRNEISPGTVANVRDPVPLGLQRKSSWPRV
jgi:hypothetical protein